MTALGIDIGGSSVKIALLDGERMVATGRSDTYAQPDGEGIAAAIRGAIADAVSPLRPETLTTIGICAPGVFDPATRTITLAVNMPGLVGVNLDELIQRAVWEENDPSANARATGRPNVGSQSRPTSRPTPPPTHCTDAHAAAVDFWAEARRPGRLLCLSIGTGVGACVLDDGAPLVVTGRSCGHVGQMDVSLEEDAPLGPDGGRGSLEAYLGVPGLRARYGERPGGVEAILAAVTVDDPPIRALVRALRIAHALYRPDRIALLGGVGVRLARLAPAIRTHVERDLTRLARPGWSLEAGRHDWHAAAGAARLSLAGGR